MGVAIVEMGVEEKMAPEDQHGGYSHPPAHGTSSDLGTSLQTSWTDSMAILTCVAARNKCYSALLSQRPCIFRLDLAVLLF